jgi:hypothetical protein
MIVGQAVAQARGHREDPSARRDIWREDVLDEVGGALGPTPARRSGGTSGELAHDERGQPGAVGPVADLGSSPNGDLSDLRVHVALGAARSARVGDVRAGYRHGTRARTLTTSLGPTTITMPRARRATAAGGTTEWASAAVPRYQRRTARVDEAILGVYLSGGNTRRLKGALAPRLRGGPLGVKKALPW